MGHLGHSMDASRDITRRIPAFQQGVIQRQITIPAWFLSKDGYWLYARYIQPEDQPRLLALFEQLSTQTRWLRFHTNVDHLSAEMIATYAHDFAAVDNLQSGGAIVAIDYRTVGQGIVGVARLGAPEDGVAEVAVVVRDDFQGRGVGRALVQRLPTLAWRMGVHTLVASVAANNLPAARLFRNLSFPITSHTTHAETEARISLFPK